MFDKWKIRQELCKVYKMYDKKAHSVLYSKACDNIAYNQLQDIKYAITYMLCEYFDLNYEFYYNNLPFSYKWNIAYDYIKYHDRCKEAYEQFIKENNSNNTQEFDLAKPLRGEITDKKYLIITRDGKFHNDYITKLIKGNVYYDIGNNKQYIFDGKNLVEMC